MVLAIKISTSKQMIHRSKMLLAAKHQNHFQTNTQKAFKTAVKGSSLLAHQLSLSKNDPGVPPVQRKAPLQQMQS